MDNLVLEKDPRVVFTEGRDELGFFPSRCDQLSVKLKDQMTAEGYADFADPHSAVWVFFFFLSPNSLQSNCPSHLCQVHQGK